MVLRLFKDDENYICTVVSDVFTPSLKGMKLSRVLTPNTETPAMCYSLHEVQKGYQVVLMS